MVTSSVSCLDAVATREDQGHVISIRMLLKDLLEFVMNCQLSIF